MIRSFMRALTATVVLALLFGLAYPLVMTGFAQLVFRGKANGSILARDGNPVGSALIGQSWSGPEWFYGRPSATNYDASNSGGSNLGPASRSLAERIEQRAHAILAVEGPYVPGLTVAAIPADLLTASASGLDPDISPAAAKFQAPRIAATRHLALTAVVALIQRNVHRVPLDLFSAPHVDVLELNLALDRMSSRK
jgi:K+-transporting ATPase ATPase C chain